MTVLLFSFHFHTSRLHTRLSHLLIRFLLDWPKADLLFISTAVEGKWEETSLRIPGCCFQGYQPPWWSMNALGRMPRQQPLWAWLGHCSVPHPNIFCFSIQLPALFGTKARGFESLHECINRCVFCFFPTFSVTFGGDARIPIASQYAAMYWMEADREDI